MWEMVAQAGIAGMQGLLNGASERIITQANNRTSIANARASNTVRAANNALSAANGNMARWVQSVNNNRLLKNGGAAMEEAITNGNRTLDAQQRGKLSEAVKSAEFEGMAAASVGAAGVGGSVVDMINAASTLRSAMSRQQVATDTALFSSDVGRKIGNISSQMLGGLDGTVLLDSLDYGKDVARTQATTSNLTNFLKGALPALSPAMSGLVAKGGQAAWGSLMSSRAPPVSPTTNWPDSLGNRGRIPTTDTFSFTTP